jgi:4-nitrophenyl phosphatase
MDGVVWRGPDPIGDLPTIMDEISQLGWKFILATNNSTRTPSQYLEKLRRFGVSLESWQVINSSQATAHYLSQEYPEGGAVYVVGEEGLENTLTEKGFYHDSSRAAAVVVGMDRTLTYEKLRLATLLIRTGAKFIGTNPDRTFPTPEGLIPGAGAILAALQAATDVQPIVIGKPQPEMYRIALERLGTNPEETLVVGDRLETDIAGAQNLGCPTGLVLSGVTSRKALQEWSLAPDFLAEDLEDLVKQLK